MRLQVLSDIHTEFHKDSGEQFIHDYLRPKDVDVLIVAGDLAGVGCIERTVALLAKAYHNSWILFVPGNHEYYGGSIPKINHTLRHIFRQFENTVFLNNKMISINGIDFVGTPMWFRHNNENVTFSNRVNDFRMIQNFDSVVVKENKKAIEFLKWHVTDNSIVITHHMPTLCSVPGNFKHDPTNMFYVCDMEKLIKKRKPKLWVHGHTHHSFNYLLGKTHVVCNPLGYLGKQINAEFILNMMLDL